MRESTKVLQKVLPKIIGAEIGVCYGDNARTYFTHLPGLYRLHLVDDLSELKDTTTGIDYRKDLGRALRDISPEMLIWHTTTSMDASKEITDNSLDFVYIDADHTYEKVLQDCRLWWPKVRLGGVLCGHDFHDNPPTCNKDDVAKAVGDFSQEIKSKVNHDQNVDDESVGLRGIHDWWILKDV